MSDVKCQCTGEAGDSCCDVHCIDPDIYHDEPCPDIDLHRQRATRSKRIRDAERRVIEAAERLKTNYDLWMSQGCPDVDSDAAMAVIAAVRALEEAANDELTWCGNPCMGAPENLCPTCAKNAKPATDTFDGVEALRLYRDGVKLEWKRKQNTEWTPTGDMGAWPVRNALSADAHFRRAPEKREHVLKTREPYFTDVELGRKAFELRKDDRGFEVGDSLRLVCEPADGREVRKTISYILRDAERFGLPAGYVILGLVEPKAVTP
jgi:hypothetical protein